MAENSRIAWTDDTFNPWIGCTRVSPGCQNCYAELDKAGANPDEWPEHLQVRLFPPSPATNAWAEGRVGAAPSKK